MKAQQRTATTTQEYVPTDFDGVNIDFILKHLKELKPELLADLNLKSFYKSYSLWQKLTDDQRNKTVSYFRKLPLQLRGLYLFLLFLFTIILLLTNFTSSVYSKYH